MLPAAVAVPRPPPPPPPPLSPTGPPVLVLPYPRVLGVANLDADWCMVSSEGFRTHTFPVMPFVEAMATEHLTDAHLTCYMTELKNGEPPTAIPRLTKSFAAGMERLQAREKELVEQRLLTPDRAAMSTITRIVGNLLALDFDLPEHVTWTEPYRDKMQAKILAAAQRWPLIAAPTVFYVTSGGFRLVWALDEPVPVQGQGGLEDLLYGLVAEAHMAEITVDTACKDWTRLFRLPRVVRADKPPAEKQTWTQPYFAQSWGYISFTERHARPPAGGITTYAPGRFRPLSMMSLAEFQPGSVAHPLASKWASKIGKAPRDLRDTFRSINMGEMPTEVQSLLTNQTGTAASAAFKHIMSRFKAQAYPRDPSKALPEAVHVYKILAEGEDLRVEENGQKQIHQGIMRLVRNMCYLLQERLGEREVDISAQFIYALALQPARRANAAREKETNGTGKVRTDGALETEVWNLVTWYFQQYRGQVIVSAEEAEEAAAERESLQLRLIAQIGAHTEAIIQTLVSWSETEDPVVIDWATRHWPQILLLKHALGRSLLSFSPDGSLYYSLPTEGWADILSLGRDCGHNLIQWTYLNDDGKPVFAKDLEVYQRHSMVTEQIAMSRLIPANRIKLLRGPNGIIVQFVKALPGIRTDIVPKYDPMVDEWLHLLGGDDADTLLDWLAAFHLLHRPLSALYIQGSPSIGKGMLVQALKNMTITRSAAPFEQAMGDFQASMFATPLIWADEKVAAKHATKPLMDTFKKLVSGEYDTLNRKGVDHMGQEGHWRVVMTANHANALPWDEEVSGADLEAVRLRLVHITANSDGALRFLERNGQRLGTEFWPERNIPAHIAHLAEARVIDLSNRFLVTSKPKPYHTELQARSSGSGEVLRLLGRLLHVPHTAHDCLFIRDDHVYFNVPCGYTRMMSLIGNERRPEFPRSERLLSRSIRHVAIGEESSNMRVVVPGAKEPQSMRVWKLNMRLILDWLDKNDQNADLRHTLGPIIWERDAPDSLKRAVMADPVNMETVRRPPPPPPPPSNVIKMPTIGFQKAHE
jgi:hypothetical protein